MSNYLVDNIPGKLGEIIQYKSEELIEVKKQLSLAEIKSQLNDKELPIRDFVFALKKTVTVSLIAEVKKASPSLGDINIEVDVVEQAEKYEQAGANAISVLTDKNFFKGDIEFLKQIKQTVNIPVFRKDFIFDPYQIYQSKFYGADALLLMAAILTERALVDLVELAHQLGLKCLVEVHTQADLAKALKTHAVVVGINARNLSTLEIDLDNIIKLAPQVPKDRILIAESGISRAEDVLRLKSAGVSGILVGTTLMLADSVEAKIRELKLYD